MATFIGCVSMADSLGNLLFYSNGVTIWNRQHEVMSNGAGLAGNSLTSQYIAVPQPGKPYLYYLFMPGYWGEFRGFQYNSIDMRRQNGMGEVVQKNVRLRASSSERVAAVPHANGRDIWIIGHERDSDVFFAYLLTSEGLSSEAVLSRVGFVQRESQLSGILKASPNGRRLALTARTNDPQRLAGIVSVELLDFDPATGRVTNPILIPPFRLTSFGLEFSPDGTKLYVADYFFGVLLQYNLVAFNIAASVFEIPVPPGGAPSNLQLGPDGRIYLSISATALRALDVITAPNRAGPACGYTRQAVKLSGQLAEQSLPSFMQRDLWSFTTAGTCQGETFAFDFPAYHGADSVRWNFGDAGSGGRNQTTGLSARHTYQQPGRYLVTLTLHLPGALVPFVLRRYLDVQPRPRPRLGRDTALCPGNSLTLRATTAGAATYRWQDGSTAATLTARRPGWYWVDAVSAAGCAGRDSLLVSTAPVPRVRLGADTVVCVGQALTLRPRQTEAGTRYRWQDGTAGPALPIKAPGTYWLEGTNAVGCTTRDSVRVYFLTPPTIYLGPDTTVCQTPEKPFALDATLPGVRYRWQDGSTSATFQPSRSGTYWVTVSTPVCSATDSIRVRLYDCAQQVFVPNIITPNGDGRNDRLEIIGLGREAWRLRVFSRWGQLVHEARPYRQDWNSAGLAGGVYFYLLEEPLTGRRLRGTVEIVR